MTLVGGTPQTAKLHQPFDAMLAVALANTNGCPVTTARPASRHLHGSCERPERDVSRRAGRTLVTVGTNASGQANAPAFTANGSAGSYTVTASSDYGTRHLLARRTPRAGSPQRSLRSHRRASRRPPGAAIAQPLQATVLDANGNPVDGATVTFALGSSGGRRAVRARPGASFARRRQPGDRAHRPVGHVRPRLLHREHDCRHLHRHRRHGRCRRAGRLLARQPRRQAADDRRAAAGEADGDGRCPLRQAVAGEAARRQSATRCRERPSRSRSVRRRAVVPRGRRLRERGRELRRRLEPGDRDDRCLRDRHLAALQRQHDGRPVHRNRGHRRDDRRGQLLARQPRRQAADDHPARPCEAVGDDRCPLPQAVAGEGARRPRRSAARSDGDVHPRGRLERWRRGCRRFRQRGRRASPTARAKSTETTNASGIATSPRFSANTTAGRFTATAATSGTADVATFSLDNSAGKSPTITAEGQEKRSATVGGAYAKPLQAKVRDANGKPLQGVERHLHPRSRRRR